MPVGFQTLLIFVFAYLLLSLLYDTSHYLPQIFLINNVFKQAVTIFAKLPEK